MILGSDQTKLWVQEGLVNQWASLQDNPAVTCLACQALLFFFPGVSQKRVLQFLRWKIYTSDFQCSAHKWEKGHETESKGTSPDLESRLLLIPMISSSVFSPNLESYWFSNSRQSNTQFLLNQSRQGSALFKIDIMP